MSITIKVTLDEAPNALRTLVSDLVSQAGQEVKSRGIRTANELRTASNHVLRGQRHGRRYKVPGTYRLQMDKVTGKKRHGRYYTASAPGEPPAVRTGAFRLGWKQRSYAEDLGGGQCNVHGVIENDQKVGSSLLGEMLENGTKRMAPRPYKQKVVSRALPQVIKIYNESYFNG